MKKVGGTYGPFVKMISWLSRQCFVRLPFSTITQCYSKRGHYINELYDLLAKIIYIGLEWYLYTNLKQDYLYRCLYLTNQNQQIFFATIVSVMNRAVESVSRFLHKIGANLKNTKCVVHRSASLIYLADISLVPRNTDFLIRPSQKSLNFLFDSIRKILYHKNAYGLWRRNTYMSSSQAMIRIKNILHLWHSKNSCILSKAELTKINITVDKIFYIWQVKK